KSAARAMQVECIALKRARIGLIVADHQIAKRREGGHQRAGGAALPVPEHAHMPGPRHPAPSRREAVNRYKCWRAARRERPIDLARDRGVIGTVELRDTAGP